MATVLRIVLYILLAIIPIGAAIAIPADVDIPNRDMAVCVYVGYLYSADTDAAIESGICRVLTYETAEQKDALVNGRTR